MTAGREVGYIFEKLNFTAQIVADLNVNFVPNFEPFAIINLLRNNK